MRRFSIPCGGWCKHGARKVCIEQIDNRVRFHVNVRIGMRRRTHVMNITKKITTVLTMAMFGAVYALHGEVVNITQGSTTGYELTDGNTYVIQNSVEFSNSTAGGSGMSVADGATVVIYIPKDVTLTAIGANGSGQIGGGAGIRVPETATLVIYRRGKGLCDRWKRWRW